jgi:myo-inositol catabolism protein IolC
LSGFAIGRSVFWKAGTAFLSGTLTAERAVDQMASTYIALVDAYCDAQRLTRSAG